MPGSAGLVGVGESVTTILADVVASACVLIVGRDIPDSFVETHSVVVDADPFKFSSEDPGVGDSGEVRVFTFDVAPQRFDPGLIGRGCGTPEMLSD